MHNNRQQQLDPSDHFDRSSINAKSIAVVVTNPQLHNCQPDKLLGWLPYNPFTVRQTPSTANRYRVSQA